MKYLISIITFLLACIIVQASDPSLIQNAVKLSIKEKYEESEQLLKTIPEKDIASHDLYHFARLLNNFALNNKSAAEKHAKALEGSFQNELPTRYKSLIYMMSEDIKQWKENDLKDIGRDMKMSHDRLANAQGGEKTQKIQKDIIDKLDKLIKEKEDKKAADAKAKEDEANGKETGKETEQGESQNNKQGEPAQESHVTGNSGAGKIDEKRFKKASENWGTLPPAKRAAITQEVIRDFPPKYKPVIEDYFKKLNTTPSRK